VGLEGMRNALIYVSVSERTRSSGLCCDALHMVLPLEILMKTPKVLGVGDGCWVIAGCYFSLKETSFSWLLLDTNVSSDAISHLRVHLSSFWPTCQAEGNEVRQLKIEPILYSNLMQTSTLVCDLLHHAMNKS
jgi:hypothetical protein